MCRNEAIREKNISREEGIKLVEEFDGSCGENYIKDFCEYIEISIDEFWKHVHKSLNKDLFTITGEGKIIRKFKVGIGL